MTSVVDQELLAAALEYAARVPVFPIWAAVAGGCTCPAGKACRSAGKHPATPGGYKDATQDSSAVIKWWGERPYNIGTPTSWAVVVDVDPRHGGDEALARLEAEHGPLPETAEVLTGGGGRHVYFAPVPGLRCSAGRVGPGLDVKAEGGYVLLPPSMHVSGRRYEAEVERPLFEVALAEMPAWLVALAMRPATASNGHGGAAAVDEVIPGGQRNTVLASLAGSMRRRGMTPEEIKAALAAVNARRCHPPLDDEEVRAIAASVGRYPAAASAFETPPVWTPPTDRPQIDAGGLLDDMARRAHAAIAKANQPPRLFAFGTAPAWLRADESGQPVVEVLRQDEIRHHLADVAVFFRMRPSKRKGEPPVMGPALPPLPLCADLLVAPPPALPRLVRIVRAPSYTPDWRLLTVPGHDPESGLYFAPRPGLIVPAVAGHPTRKDVEAAVELLRRDWCGDFPFLAPDDFANLLALLLTLMVRESVPGHVPLFLTDKPAPGTGASLLVRTLAIIVTGRPAAAMTLSREPEEIRKRLTAALIRTPELLLLDNVAGRVDSDALAAIITAGEWEDRLLGLTQVVRLPIRTVLVLTGNNVQLSNELARRSVLIRLDPRTEAPWERTNFRHRDLEAWVDAHRGRLLGAALTLVQAWRAAGAPPGAARLGGFDPWSATIGGILATAGIPGFLENARRLMATVDVEMVATRAFLGDWWRRHGEERVATRALLEIAREHPIDLAARSDHGTLVRLGRLLTTLRDRPYTLPDVGAVVVRHEALRTASWRLEPVPEDRA